MGVASGYPVLFGILTRLRYETSGENSEEKMRASVGLADEEWDWSVRVILDSISKCISRKCLGIF